MHLNDSKGAITAISLAFAESQETCYQLVRHLERQSIKKGVGLADKLPHDENGTVNLELAARQDSARVMSPGAPAA